MQVALVIHDFKPDNGQGRYAIELARRLANRCSFHVYANTFAPEALPAVTCHSIPAIRSRYILAIFSFLVGAERRLRKARNSLIHAQGLTCWGADVATVHICNAARARVLAPAERGSRLFARLIMPLEARFYRQRRLNYLITMSRRLETEVREHYGWRGPVAVVPHGTDVEAFRPLQDGAERHALRHRFGVPAEGWVWLFVGEAVKGLSTTLGALQSFPRATLLVVSRSVPAPYLAEADALGVRSRLVFRGFDSDPASVYRAADVLVAPTQYESFGMVVAEAMASGIPVVVGREAGVAELITDGLDGLLVPAEDPGAVVQAMRWLVENESRARALGSRARTTIQEYSWDRCAEATWAVYQSAWEAKRRAGAIR